MSPQEVLLRHVAPGVGVLIAVLQFGSPLRAVRAADRAKDLGELNSLPFCAMCINCCIGVMYGSVTSDLYIYCGNLAGLTLGCFFLLTCMKWAQPKAQDLLRCIGLLAAGLFCVLGAVGMLAPVSSQKLWGSAGLGSLLVFYISPLTTLARVLRTRDSSSLHAGLCVMNIVNGACWLIYGLALRDYWFIALPNAVGAAFNCVCLLLRALLPARAGEQGSKLQRSTAPSLRRLLSSFALRTSSRQASSSQAASGGQADCARTAGCAAWSASSEQAEPQQ